MTYFLGLLGVLQMMLIPGLILYRLLNDVRQKNFWINLPLIFALSFIVNYFLVFGLTSFHVYLPHVLRTITGVELFILVMCYPRFLSLPMFTAEPNFRLFDGSTDLDKKYTQWYFLIFCLLFLTFIGLWINSIGQVFGLRDPAVSYNIWAMAWSDNTFPTLTWHYPQLLTTNWSIPYVMMGSLPNHVVLEMFPASLNLLFPIFFMIIFFELFSKEQQRGFLLAAILLSLFMAKAWAYLRTGHMDWVCAFLNLLALKLVYQLSIKASKKFSVKAYLQIMLILAASALAKPAGITSVVLIPLLLVALVRFDNIKRPELLLLSSYLLLALLVAPWYIYAEYHETLNHGHGADLLFLIWGIFRFNSWVFYFNEILFFGWVSLALLLASFFFAKSLPRFWRFVFYFYSPYFFVWAIFYSYDDRNLALLLPILCISMGLIIAHHRIDIGIVNYFKPRLHKFNHLPILLIILLLSAIFAFFANPWYRGHLIQHELYMKNQIYDFRQGVVDLKAYSNCPGFNGKVLASMLTFNTIPMIAAHTIHLPPSYFGPNMLPQTFSDTSVLQRALTTYPDIHYFLFDMKFIRLVTTDGTRNLFQNWQDTGKIKIVLNHDNILLYEIKVPLQQLNFSVIPVPAAKK